ncbi:MAG: glycosyltransferase N-terminal domain-containing protein [Saprospiraceae bacterium]|nr:glycosyltransferase N-terminal domain-containing protein [Saprospiraceae bacterium]
MGYLMLLMYEFVIRLFMLGIHIAAKFNAKAQLWVQGRRNWRAQLKSTLNGPQSTVNSQQSTVNSQQSSVLWLHAASLGEFEQGRPVMEAFRAQFPDWKIVLTFFSPSGYEVRKDYPHADLVCYLPADTRQNARDFLELIQPDVVIFVKYEFWANYLFELKKRGVPTLLVSALFSPSQPFFKWYGSFWRKMLGCFTQIFVQNEASGKLLQSIGIQNVTVAGDTRVDRVLKIAESAAENEIVQAFTEDVSEPVLVVGSSWEPDEAVIFGALIEAVTQSHRLNIPKLIIAPHEPSEANVERICRQAGNAVRYSRWFKVIPSGSSEVSPSCLVIDNIGLLNTLYRYGTVAYIGGGFGKDIHNTLEPAAFGLPIIFGPKYEKFEEARQFVARGGAFPVRNAEELAAILGKLQDPVFYRNASDAVRAYLEENRGARGKVMTFLEKEFV